MTILLVFLLKSYSVDPPVRPDDSGFQLASTASEQPVGPATDIDVTADGIYVDGLRTASSAYYRDRDDALVRELYDALQGRSAKSVNVRADGRTPYRLLGKVMFTLQESGVERITLVAQSRAGL
jgi:biopolymer transport protein ExbD